ncbi:hypothetical protein D8674_034616 [Pyrus ussuriensis x Pyrus communis]|uniref:Uncharacterized protein n=1 Tax=Pyrus ussuriensis x Pyrus communis TaxID=2448454 RepID=A0A5N5GFU6_9ROSA|nr:hypothetical protein D8674_034616 [Pyrus ussuriensis x Pyrus communis]
MFQGLQLVFLTFAVYDSLIPVNDDDDNARLFFSKTRRKKVARKMGIQGIPELTFEPTTHSGIPHSPFSSALTHLNRKRIIARSFS